jgi:hypothetical protein
VYSSVTAFSADKAVVDLQKEEAYAESLDMLTSLLSLQEDIERQIALSTTRLHTMTSEAEKANLKKELKLLDRQFVRTDDDFDRIATGVEVDLFATTKSEEFNWKDEFTILIEPAVKELKRLTRRTRNKTRLKDTIHEYEALLPVAQGAVQHLVMLLNATENQQIQEKIKVLLPEWKNVEHAILNKLQLTELELATLEEQEVNFTDLLSNSTKNFFRNRGVYLLGAVVAFVCVLLLFRLVYHVIFSLLPAATKEKPPFYMRLIELFYRFFAVIFAGLSFFFVLYLAEDWFLLSMAIIFFLGLLWTLQRGFSKIWQQARLMLNVGSIREGERVIVNGVPWKVEHIHIFCKLYNPFLDIRFRVPIEEMVGKVSRVSKPEDSWFPCKKGDWVVVGNKPRGKVLSLTPESVELIERGGKRIFYLTQDFLNASPVNLSRNFRLRVPFGISYSLQSQSTTTIPQTLQNYIEDKLEEHGYAKGCLNLSVEFMQAGESSLDLIVLADFKGDQADIYARLERFIQRCCVESCTINNWEIPFPQLTLHGPEMVKR